MIRGRVYPTPDTLAYKALLERLRVLGGQDVKRSHLERLAREAGFDGGRIQVAVAKLVNSGVVQRVATGLYRVDGAAVSLFLGYGGRAIACVPANTSFYREAARAAQALGAPPEVAQRAADMRWILSIAGDRFCDLLLAASQAGGGYGRRAKAVAWAYLVMRESGIYVPPGAAQALGVDTPVLRKLLHRLERILGRARPTPLEEAVRATLERLGAEWLAPAALEAARGLHPTAGGRSPWVLAALAIHVAARRAGARIPLASIARAAGVTEAAVRIAMRALNHK